ncbi:MAG: 5-methyltetrahydropteroyltriglutamate--homocysteine methyltransferase [Alphaproteobacteria bacterium MarineAlpha10_Bin2]|nr:MAG: 5-methyltetrahydropteroyltriglutamate--homocysteine methyltransferase [Alphaproteobacteria bacterium MarineAlpha10_Bin2]
MKHSSERILTTHVGSLPRPDDVMDFLTAKETGEPYDRAAFDSCMRRAVRDVVAEQVALGIDVVSDGEASKPGYATYIQDRLTGFSGTSPPIHFADLDGFPKYRVRMGQAAAVRRIVRARCTGPVAVRDTLALEADLENFRDALDASEAEEGFLNAASPGVIAIFQSNDYYPSHETYLAALAAAMKEEYSAVTRAGFLLQVDCPDLAMGRHVSFSEMSDAEFLKQAELNVEALNEALADVPAESVRMHICWGNYEGPHHCDIGLEKILNIIVKAKPSAISVEAANPRHAHEWAVLREMGLPDDKILIPGLIDSTSNYIEHPELVAQRIQRFADVIGRERVIAGVDCGFGTFAGIGKVDPKICQLKLKALAEGAALASERLW